MRRTCIIKSEFYGPVSRVYWYELSEEFCTEDFQKVDLYYSNVGTSSIQTLPITNIETVPENMVKFDIDLGYPVFIENYSNTMAGGF